SNADPGAEPEASIDDLDAEALIRMALGPRNTMTSSNEQLVDALRASLKENEELRKESRRRADRRQEPM
uniref:Type I polyketide synthase PikAIII, Type I polyketide synthase PikAIV fusion protein n=1 Tax=Streptomyces venezuelae TaxID=54571 RepID=UPI00018F449A|nr:Chain A, Type I polyketide synthase PikAIII, Type I polyketide synthase PikAIV fusion protein [Streptomyces venezuelae]3F5H_B Chain B, Type I polyketide synthase PikAIII, Type I polyketide synthase PikAIV fusion protein [Streptomyces venezuelae]